MIWAQSFTRIAWIAGVFSLVLGALLVYNSIRLYRGPGNGKVRLAEARELAPLKAALREDPKNDALKQQIRELDRELRREYFRREQLASRGGWTLLGSAVVFISALQLAAGLRKPAVKIPNITARREDPVKTSALAARTVAGTTLGLAGLATALFWETDNQWQGGLTTSAAKPGIPVATATANDPAWFPTDEEIAKNWPRFRGPDGSGITKLTDLPETWDAPSGKNLVWKTAIPLPGENSPVVWGDRIYLTGANNKSREVYCFDAKTGSMLWKEPVSTPQSARAEPPEVMEDTGFAAPTAATDGRRVFAIFANGDIAGFSTDGKRLWAHSLGTPENMYGHATSLTLWRNRVIVVLDQGGAKDAKSKIMALDSNTGEPVWTTSRPVPNSWVSPILIKHEGSEQIITSADPWVIAYDPATGKELWKAKCMRGDVAASPAYANGLVYVASDQSCIAAIKPDGTGDVTDSHIAWQNDEKGLPDTCSLLCDGPRVYTMVFGIFYAFDALTGKHLWAHETNAKCQASPALVNGRINLLTTDGVDIIGEADAEGFKETGRATLGEGTGATPAYAPGRIYLRGKKHLFCIGKKDGH
ncbi:MAG: PQQ-binding-like beta-propeller repeat protein [Verrucomicrobiota bacterium]